MPREIVSICIGQAGIQLGQHLWEQYCLEHSIDSNGNTREKIKDQSFQRFFEETDTNQYVPRNLMIDSEPNVIDDVLASKYKLFHPQFLLSGTEDAANNFARGHYSIGAEMIDNISDRVRKLVDNCDNFQGFTINHSVSGGTGGGIGSLLLMSLSADYTKKDKIGFEIYPSPTISDSVVDPYNALLTTHFLLDHTQVSLVLDNEAIYSTCQKWLDIRRPSYSNLNRLFVKSISSMTSTLRFEGEEANVNCNDLKDFQTNLVPFPRLHFLITSFAPLFASGKRMCFGGSAPRIDVQMITEQCFAAQNFFVKIADFDAEEDKYMAIQMNYHGDVKVKEANAVAQWLKLNKKVTFVEWCPTGFKINLNEKPIQTLCQDDIRPTKRNCVMFANNTAMQRVFYERISKKFDLLYSQKAFVHWYFVEGMEESDFDEAREDLGFMEMDYLDVLCEEATNSEPSDLYD